MPHDSVRKKVQVWIYRIVADSGLEVLLLKTLPSRGGYWQPVTGSVEEGESPEMAAEREAFEESGLLFKGRPLYMDLNVDFDSKWGRTHEEVWAIEASPFQKTAKGVRLDAHEHEAYRWVLADDAFDILKYESNRQGLQAFIHCLAPLQK